VVNLWLKGKKERSVDLMLDKCFLEDIMKDSMYEAYINAPCMRSTHLNGSWRIGKIVWKVD
jgi:hypothetical protein